MDEIGKAVKGVPRGWLICKLLFVALCMFVAIDGHHPPALAQEQGSGANVYTLGVHSAEQTIRIDDVVKAQAAQDAKIEKIEDAEELNSKAIGGFQMMASSIGGVLGLLQLLSMVFVLRKDRK